MTEDSRRPPAPQGSADLGPLEPFAILHRNDGSFSVAARASGNVVSIAPLVAIPDPPKRRIFECPCQGCGRCIVMSEWPSGMVTVVPLSKPPDDDIPF
jgi:hypothetical protein